MVNWKNGGMEKLRNGVLNGEIGGSSERDSWLKIHLNMACRDTITIKIPVMMMLMMMKMMMMVMMLMMIMMVMRDLIDKTKGEKAGSSNSNARQAVEQKVPLIIIIIVVIIIILITVHCVNVGSSFNRKKESKHYKQVNLELSSL